MYIQDTIYANNYARHTDQKGKVEVLTLMDTLQEEMQSNLKCVRACVCACVCVYVKIKRQQTVGTKLSCWLPFIMKNLKQEV